MQSVFSSLKQRISFCFQTLREHVLRWIKPPATSLALGTIVDLTRNKTELLAENALLRHQLIILRRQVKRLVFRKTDRLFLVILARMTRTWKQALFLVQPDTLLRWYRELFRWFWKRKSKAQTPRTPALVGDDQFDPAKWPPTTNFGERSAFGVNCSSWISE